MLAPLKRPVDTGQELIERSRSCLTVLDENDHKEALSGIADFLDTLLEGCRQ